MGNAERARLDRGLHQRRPRQLRAGQRGARMRHSPDCRLIPKKWLIPHRLARSCSSGSCRRSPDPTTPPQFLVLPAIAALPPATVTRQLALLEEMSMDFADAQARPCSVPSLAIPNTGGAPRTMRMWMDHITENTALGATETWEFYNGTVDAHPMHIHEVVFKLVNRQGISHHVQRRQQDLSGRSRTPPPLPPPRPWKRLQGYGHRALPGQYARRAKFITPGQFVWHCHIVEHEDNEMMRPVLPSTRPPASPAHRAGQLQSAQR